MTIDSYSEHAKSPIGKSTYLPPFCIIPKTIRTAVVNAVCDERVFDINPMLVLSERRYPALAHARYMVIFLFRVLWGDASWTGAAEREWASYPQVGLAINREHSTAMYGWDRACERFDQDREYRRMVLAALDVLDAELPDHADRIRAVRAKVGNV